MHKGARHDKSWRIRCLTRMPMDFVLESKAKLERAAERLMRPLQAQDMHEHALGSQGAHPEAGPNKQQGHAHMWLKSLRFSVAYFRQCLGLCLGRAPLAQCEAPMGRAEERLKLAASV